MLKKLTEKMPKKLLALPVTASAFLMTSMMAFADEADSTATPVVGQSAINSIFGVLNGVANALKTGLQTVVVPIGAVACLYFLVRMLIASDAKDVAMYKKRCITTAIIVVVAFAIPGLIDLMKEIGENIDSQL